MNSEKEEFLKEFKELLEKYNVSISFTVGECSDTHGLYGEQMLICHNIPKSFKSEIWLEIDGWDISNTDIK